jgi:maltooligosyltrehalose trehalohydrolase
MFAPTHCYGDYDAFKRFVDAAHALKLAVILDVVYNHLGPDGNYLAQYSDYYFSDRHTTEWGPPLNFDGEHCKPVREFIIANACEWVREFHLDGLRLDATQSIHDDSELHLLAEMGSRVRHAAAPRSIILVAENEPQHASHLLEVERGGMALDAMWNDDFHHSAHVAATGRREAYYHDYSGLAQEFVSAAKHGFLYQGQYYEWQKHQRGQPLQTPLSSCVTFLENHDQVANSLYGKRLAQMTSAARYRALVALLLLAPQTPMLFMGQEFNCSSPFLFFVDHASPLSEDIAKGRKQFLSQFPSVATVTNVAQLIAPSDENTFQRCKLNWDELPARRQWLQLYTDLLTLRRTDPVIAAQAVGGIDGAVLTLHCFVLRWFDAVHGDRLLLVNLGISMPVQPRPEPLLASPPGRRWAMRWSSEHPDYDGTGAVNPLTDRGWQLPAESAVLFTAV